MTDEELKEKIDDILGMNIWFDEGGVPSIMIMAT